MLWQMHGVRSLFLLACMCGEWAVIDEFRDLDVEIEFVRDRVMMAPISVFEPVLI